MKRIEEFFKELDERWKPTPSKKIRLEIIGASALLLQTAYDRGTKDSDVLETAEISQEISRQLLALAGRPSPLFTKFRIYIDIVKLALPFLPQAPKFHEVPNLSNLNNFSLHVLDVTDIVVSKLKRFNANDISDIEFIISADLVEHKTVVERFKSVIDLLSTDARAEEFPKYVQNLNTIERDMFQVPETRIDLPDWI